MAFAAGAAASSGKRKRRKLTKTQRNIHTATNAYKIRSDTDTQRAANKAAIETSSYKAKRRLDLEARNRRIASDENRARRASVKGAVAAPFQPTTTQGQVVNSVTHPTNPILLIALFWGAIVVLHTMITDPGVANTSAFSQRLVGWVRLIYGSAPMFTTAVPSTTPSTPPTPPPNPQA